MFQTVLFAILTAVVGLIHWQTQRAQRQLDQLLADSDRRSPEATRSRLRSVPVITSDFHPDADEDIITRYRKGDAFDRLNELFTCAPETISYCSLLDYDETEHTGRLLAYVERGELICFRFDHHLPHLCGSIYRNDLVRADECSKYIEFTVSNNIDLDGYRLYFKEE